MKLRMLAMFHRCGVRMARSWDRDLGEIVEEVVEEDLPRQHRQEGEEQHRARHAEHVAEVRAGAHQEVLHDVRKGLPALEDALVEDAQAALAEQDVGRGGRGRCRAARTVMSDPANRTQPPSRAVPTTGG
jgi:hypothetical protein